jgi:transposase
MKQMVGMVRARGQGRPYPASDRARALDYAARLQREGVGLARIAREVGVAPNTLVKWLRASPFEPVEVVAVERRGHILHGPRGVRVEGLSLEEIAQLIRSLG